MVQYKVEIIATTEIEQEKGVSAISNDAMFKRTLLINGKEVYSETGKVLSEAYSKGVLYPILVECDKLNGDILTIKF